MLINRKKTDTLTVSLPKDLKKSLLKYAQDRDITASQVTKDALRYYIFLNEWKQLQKAFDPAFKKAGIKTDEDVEKYFG